MANVVVPNVSDGLNQASPESLQNSECQNCLNVDFAAIMGAWVSRKGTAKLNTSALPGAVLANFKLYTTAASYRYTQAGGTQFRNFAKLKSSIQTAKPVYSVGYKNQGFFSDGNTMWVDDGTSSAGYPWGISPPANAVTVSTGTQPSVFLAHFDGSGTGSEAWQGVIGTQSFDTSTFKEGQASLSIIADSTSFRGLSTLTYAAPTDLSTSAGQATVPNGTFQVWVWVSDSTALNTVTLQVDVNDATFQKDYYTYALTPSANPAVQAQSQVNSVYQQLQNQPGVPAGVLRNLQAQANNFANIPVNIPPLSTNGWTQLSIPITSFVRTGSTSGKGWNTAKGVLVSFNASGLITVKFDAWTLLGNSQAAVNGTYYYYETFQQRDTGGNLLNESNASPISLAFNQVGGAAVVTSTNTTTNTMVNYRGFYRIGGIQDQAYQIGTATYTGGTATLTDTSNDIGLMLANVPLATDNFVSPGGYGLLEGPHYDRIFAGSGITLRWTKVNMPHSFPSTSTAPIPGAQSGDAIVAIKRFAGRLFVFTSSQVFEFAGDSDSNFQFVKTLSRTGTPAGRSVVDAGDRMIYLGGQGTNLWGLYEHNGTIDRKVSFEKLQPLFSGRTAGILPLNSSGVSACSAVYYKDSYWLAYPSGNSGTPNAVLRVDYGHSRSFLMVGMMGMPVMIYAYSLPSAITCLSVEEVDGLLAAGGGDGFLYQIETGQTDAGNSVAYSWQSKDFPLGDDFKVRPYWQNMIDMDSQGQAVVTTAYYDSNLNSSVLGTSSSSGRSWTPAVKGQAAQLPRRNFSIGISGTATSEVRVYGFRGESVEQ